MRWLLLVLVACKPIEIDDKKRVDDDTAVTTPTPSPTTPSTPEGHPEFSNPDEATDLDADPDVLHVALTAAAHTHSIGGEQIAGYAYNGQTPGPTLRMKIGDTLIVDLQNDLDVETTIHWHGVAAPYDMDGVTWQMAPVAAGDSFTYQFEIHEAGTFWYHPHFDTESQVDLGLYGVLIVEDPAEPSADEELIMVFDAWDEVSDHTDEAADHHGLDPARVAWTVNGGLLPIYEGTGGTTARVRVLNVSNTGYLDLPPMRQIGEDQGLLPAAIDDERAVLGPGDRVEFEWLIEDSWTLQASPYSVNGGEAWGDDFDLLEIEVASTDSATPVSWPFSGDRPSIDPGHTDIVYVFTGESGGEGWMINAEIFPDVTVEELPLGAEAIVEIRNLSPAEHPFHMHGHHFEVLSLGGEIPAFKRITDTVNLPIGQALRIRLVADNPGDWMTHCHILPHAHQGMMTVLRVLE